MLTTCDKFFSFKIQNLSNEIQSAYQFYLQQLQNNFFQKHKVFIQWHLVSCTSNVVRQTIRFELFHRTRVEFYFVVVLSHFFFWYLMIIWSIGLHGFERIGHLTYSFDILRGLAETGKIFEQISIELQRLDRHRMHRRFIY